MAVWRIVRFHFPGEEADDATEWWEVLRDGEPIIAGVTWTTALEYVGYNIGDTDTMEHAGITRAAAEWRRR